MSLLAAAAAAVGADEEPVTIGDWLAGGKPALALRYRYEHVDQEGFARDAGGSTLRLRLNYETDRFRNFGAFIEFDYVATLFPDDFNSGGGTSPNRVGYPVIADPDGADLNQLYLDYSGLDKTVLRVGRQRILLDNQRFVGGVGWRQNEQTYDAFTLKNASVSGTEMQYAYISRVDRIFGDRSPDGRHDGDTHLLHLAVGLKGDWMLSPYAYFIDNDDVPAFSTTTFGLRTTGGIKLGGYDLTLAGEVATQTDAGAAPVSYRADYLRLDAAIKLNEVLSVGLGYEVLGGDAAAPGKAFRTPLATLHAFQGWADQFLSTPDAGVEDLLASVSYRQKDWNLQGTYHHFTAESGNATWGGELDLSASRRLGERYELLLKAALFDADSPAFTDVMKFWLMLTASY
jgi:hypothetical protein